MVATERPVVVLPDSAHFHAAKYGEIDSGWTPSARSTSVKRSEVNFIVLDMSRFYRSEPDKGAQFDRFGKTSVRHISVVFVRFGE
jgi:hypothetical protein